MWSCGALLLDQLWLQCVCSMRDLGSQVTLFPSWGGDVPAGYRYVILDIPLLFETNRLTKLMKYTVLVYW